MLDAKYVVANPEAIKVEDIKEIVRKHPNVLEQREPEITVNTVSSKTEELRVYFWIKDITKTANTTGEIKTSLYQLLDQEGVVVT